MVDYLIKFILGLCVITLVLVVHAERTKPATVDFLEVQLKDDTPVKEVSMNKVYEDRTRTIIESPDAVFLYPEETINNNKDDFVEFAGLIVNDLRNVSASHVPENLFINMDRIDPTALFVDLVELPTKDELAQLYNENLYQDYLNIQQAIIALDDFRVRVFYSLKQGEFAEPLIPHLEEYQDVLDAKLENPQEFWSLVSEYEITIYLEKQNLNELQDVSSDTLYDQIMHMMNMAELAIQKTLWQDSPFLELYLDIYNKEN